jgi:hypothetical protein
VEQTHPDLVRAGEHDVTAQAEIAVADGSVAEVRGGGRLFAAGDGTAEVRAALGSLQAAAKVIVNGSGETRPFSFASDIGGILTRRGCNGAGCHGGVKGQAGFKLSDNGVHPHDDYKWIVEGGTFQVLSAEAAGEKIPRVSIANVGAGP